MKDFLWSLFVLCCLIATSQQKCNLFFKQLAGPPEEFDIHSLPSPIETALDKSSSFHHMEMEKNELLGAFKTSQVIYVDSPTLFAFSFFSPLKDSLHLQLTDPSGNVVPLEEYANEGVWPISDDGSVTVPGTTYVFENPKQGAWELYVESDKFENLEDEDEFPNVAIVVFNDSPVRAFTHLATFFTEKDKEIGLVTRLTEDLEYAKGEAPQAFRDVVISAEMDLFMPDGHEEKIPMHDNGLHFDEVANDGIYGAKIKATQVGQYLASAVINGVHSDGTKFVRSTQHIFTVVDDEMELTGYATTKKTDNSQRIKIHLGVTKSTHDKLRGYAQVWGFSETGEEIPICWIGGMTTVEEDLTVPLELDLRWAARAGAKAPYFLKEAWIQDAKTSVPIAKKDMIKVQMKQNVDHVVSTMLFEGVPEVTREMLEGVRPINFTTKAKRGEGALVLLHGYCASTNPWEEKKEDFTNGYYFLNKNANLGHDDFACKVAEFTQNLNSFGGIGHSQGGPVLLHLKNYYWTGLDNAEKGLVIQSVGSPYQGCTAAGDAANLGKLFGVGCGANSDLSRDGATLWLSGIREENRKLVNYYTTTYKQGKLLGDYCNIAINLLLQWPNDGTSELKYTGIPDAVNQGNREGWCHTTGMKYPPQYYDSKNNAAMNQRAAR